jgi:hypothetical protein
MILMQSFSIPSAAKAAFEWHSVAGLKSRLFKAFP